MELSIQDSKMAIPRNSLSHEILYIHFENIGIWLCGTWGSKPGILSWAGHFEYEVPPEESEEHWEDADSCPFSFRDNSSFHDTSQSKQDDPPRIDLVKIRVLGMRAYRKLEGLEDSNVITFGKEGIIGEMQLEDKRYTGINQHILPTTSKHHNNE